MIGDQAEQRRHKGGAHIGTCHLNPDDGLGIFFAEICRRGVNDGGVNGRAAKACHHKAHQRHLRNKSTQETAEGNSQIEQGGVAGGSIGIDAFSQHKEAAGP